MIEPVQGHIELAPASLTDAQLATLTPSRPPFVALSDARKKALFGDPTEGVTMKPEERTFVPNAKWTKNIVRHSVPRWFCNFGEVAIHIRIATHLSALLSAWEAAGAHLHVTSFSGTVAYRRTRGGDALSSHAYGIAFDINARENAFGSPPARPWEEGCVYELVKIAHEHGWFWGGHFKSNPDGMHFEIGTL